MVKKYFAAPTWQERIQFCRRPDEIRPLMAEWYKKPVKAGDASNVDGPQEVLRYANDDPSKALRKQLFMSSGVFVLLDLEMAPDHSSKFVAVEQIPAQNGQVTYLVDWEVTSGYQPMDIYTYKSDQPKDSKDFRVLAAAMNANGFYNYEFNDPKLWTAFSLTRPGEPDFSLVGYVPKNSALEREMLEQVQTEANIILRLKYPYQAVSRDQVLIEKIMHPTWFYPRKEAIAGFQ